MARSDRKSLGSSGIDLAVITINIYKNDPWNWDNHYKNRSNEQERRISIEFFKSQPWAGLGHEDGPAQVNPSLKLAGDAVLWPMAPTGCWEMALPGENDDQSADTNDDQ